MPRLDYHLTLQNRFTPVERVILLSLLRISNDIRGELGLSALTEEDLLIIVRQVLRDEQGQEPS